MAGLRQDHGHMQGERVLAICGEYTIYITLRRERYHNNTYYYYYYYYRYYYYYYYYYHSFYFYYYHDSGSFDGISSFKLWGIARCMEDAGCEKDACGFVGDMYTCLNHTLQRKDVTLIAPRARIHTWQVGIANVRELDARFIKAMIAEPNIEHRYFTITSTITITNHHHDPHHPHNPLY